MEVKEILLSLRHDRLYDFDIYFYITWLNTVTQLPTAALSLASIMPILTLHKVDSPPYLWSMKPRLLDSFVARHLQLRALPFIILYLLERGTTRI